MRKRVAIPLVLFACGWAVVAAVTVVQRAPYACGPQLFSTGCLSSFWHWLGNVATFWWVDDWEALLGAMMALLAAGLGAYFITQQIAVTRTLDNEARIRRAAANRAMLPLALSSVNAFAENCATLLTHYHTALTNMSIYAVSIPPPKLPIMPIDGLSVFSGIVEHEVDEDPRNAVSTMIADMQVLVARLQGIAEGAKSAVGHASLLEIEDALTYCVLVHGHSSNLFSYARNDTEPLSTLTEAMWNSYDILGLNHPHTYTRVERWLESRYRLDV